ncbi:MAG: translocation protein TolQ [Porticoccaceae bacterium]|nr:MAG: translocation protein TolQ [Porticoccaceae bacterium]
MIKLAPFPFRETKVLEILVAGGWLMIPILACSVAVVTVVVDRLRVLRRGKVLPPRLLGQVWSALKQGRLDRERLVELRASSPLGFVLAAALANAAAGREVMKDSIEEAANLVVHELERYLDVLSIAASVAPLLGLLGTVVGMIEVFTAIVLQGTGNTAVLAGGISEALITTAAGLTVAIPAVVFLRLFERRIEEYAVAMEEQALRLVDAIHGDRPLEGAGVRG